MGFVLEEKYFVNVTLGLLKSYTADTRDHKYIVAKIYSQIWQHNILILRNYALKN